MKANIRYWPQLQQNINGLQMFIKLFLPCSLYKNVHSLEEATGTATQAKVRLAKEGLHQIPYPGTTSADMFIWTVRRNACG